MSGHSKWASIKHKKGALDAKRGKLFTKIIREMTIAARIGGGDPDSNPRLRTAVDKAKGANMPADNIKRAIQKGTGELEGSTYEEITLEGFGPGGVAVLVEGSSDNRNRTVSEIRHIFTKNGGNLGGAGTVSYMFKPKGSITIASAKTTEEKLMEIALAVGKVDEKTTQVQNQGFIVVDTGPWILGKKVLLPAGILQSVDPDEQKIYVDRPKDEIKNAPEFDENTFHQTPYQDEIGSYYGRSQVTR